MWTCGSLTLVDLRKVIIQCKDSCPFKFWHKSHGIVSFLSMRSRPVTVCTIFFKNGWRLYLLWRHSLVTCHNPKNVFFYQKLRKGCPRGYWKYQHDQANSSARIAKKKLKWGGGGSHRPLPSYPRLPGRGLMAKTVVYGHYRYNKCWAFWPLKPHLNVTVGAHNLYRADYT